MIGKYDQVKYYLTFFKKLSIAQAILVIITLGACNPARDKSPENHSDSTNTVTDRVQKNDGWESLIHGRTGWHTYGKNIFPGAWKVEDSTLHLDASEKNGWQSKDGGDIVTDNDYKNFNLTLNWKISDGGNSGIMVYVFEDTSKFKYSWESGPEFQVADNEKNEDGKVYKSRAGDIYELVASSSQKFVKPAGQWNSEEIVSNNGKIEEYINGNHVLSTTLWNEDWKKLIRGTKFKDMPGFGTYTKGKIAFQDHGADVWFKNIRIKKL